MGGLAGGVVGGLLGFAIGGPTGARIGFGVGSTAGRLLSQSSNDSNDARAQPQLAPFQPLQGSPGAFVDLGWGSNRHSGIVIWLGSVQTIEGTPGSSGGGGGKGGPGGDGGGASEGTPPRRVATFAVLWKEVAEGQTVDGISRIWMNGKLVADPRAGLEPEAYITTDKAFINSEITGGNSPGLGAGVRHYLGTLDQEPDPAYELSVGTANASAFRGWCYSVFDSLDLQPFGNQMPYSIEAEVVSGTVTPPPVRIREFDTQVPDGALEGARYRGDLTWAESSFYGSDVNGNSVAEDHIYITHVVTVYDLWGRVIDVQQDTWRSNYVDDIVRIEAQPHHIEGAEYLGLTKMEAGQNDNPSATSFWSFYRGQSGSNNPTIAAPGGISPFSPKGYLNGQTVDYVRAAETISRTGLYYNGRVYIYNYGIDNQNGIARYTVTRPLWIADGDPEGAFFDLAGLGYLTATTTHESSRVTISAGADGYLYIAARGNPAAKFDNGVNIIRVTEDLEHVADITLSGNNPQSAWIYAWNDLLVMSEAQDEFNDRKLYLYDISDTANPVLLSTTSTTTEIGSEQIMPLPNGLFVMPDGIWSLRETVASDTVTLESIVESICAERGLNPSDYIADDLDQTVRGFKIDSPSSGRGAIEALEKAFSFDGFEDEKTLTFIKRGTSSVVTIPSDDLGAAGNEGKKNDFTRSHAQELELPATVDFGFSDWNQDYEQDWQQSDIVDTVSENIERLSSPVVMTSAEGARRADQLLRQRWTERRTISFSLGPKYSYLRPSMVVTIQAPQGNFDYRIVKINRGANMVSEIEAVAELAQNYSSTAVGNDSDSDNQQSLSTPGPTKLSIIDTIPLRDEDTGDGYYIAASGFLSAWQGAFVIETDGETETLLMEIYNGATCGYASTALADGVEGYDYTNTVTIQTTSPDATLSSVTVDGFLNNDNVAILGNEIIMFKDVTDNGNGSYTLRNLYRGFMRTPATGHAVNDRFVVLDETTIFNVDIEAAEEGTTVMLKGRSLYEKNAAALEWDAVIENNRTNAIAPQFGKAIRHPSGDYEIWFAGGLRVGGQITNLRGTEQDFDTEAYEVVPYDELGNPLGGGGSGRVLTVTFDAWDRDNEIDGKKYATYSLADQQTDNGGSAVANAQFYCYKINDDSERSDPLILPSSIPLAEVGNYDSYVTGLIPAPDYYWPLNGSGDDASFADYFQPSENPLRLIHGGISSSLVSGSPVQGGTHHLYKASSSATDWRANTNSGAGAGVNAEANSMAVCIWIRHSMTSSDPTNRPWIVEGSLSGSISWRFYIRNKDAQQGQIGVNFTYRDEDGATNIEGTELLSTMTDLNDDEWHLIILQGSTQASFGRKHQLWIDGVLDGEQNAPAAINSDDDHFKNVNASLKLGQDVASRSVYGSMDAPLIFFRTLSQSEIEGMWALRATL